MRLIEQSAARNYPSISVRFSYLLGNTDCLQGLEVTKLGISIEPAEVRLITSANDPYTWQILAEKEHLFKKNLSKHSIGAYRELCRGVGVSFEAILAPESSNAVERKALEERRGAGVCVLFNLLAATNGKNRISLAPKSASPR